MRRTCVNRSMDTARTSCSTRSTPRARTDMAHEGNGTVPRPSSPAPRQPRRLLPHPSEMATVVRPGLRLDRDRNAGRRDRHRVDVSPPLPRQGVPKTPALGLESSQHTLHLVLRLGADPTSPGERKATASGEPQPGGCEQQEARERRRARTGGHQPEDRRDGAAQGCLAGLDEPAVLLAACVAVRARSRDHASGSSVARSATSGSHAGCLRGVA